MIYTTQGTKPMLSGISNQPSAISIQPLPVNVGIVIGAAPVDILKAENRLLMTHQFEPYVK